MDAARQYRDLKRERKTISTREKDLIEQEKRLAKFVKDYVEQGLLPPSMKMPDGGTIFQRNDIRPKVKPGVNKERVAELFAKYDLDYMFSGSPNHQSLRGWLNQYLDGDESKTARERVKVDDTGVEGVPSELLDILIVEDNYSTQVNGL